MRKPCPPSVADRPEQCRQSSAAHLDMGRALFDHVSAVFFMATNCYETAEEEPQELLPILNFLIDLGDLACYARQGATPNLLLLLFVAVLPPFYSQPLPRHVALYSC